MNSKVLLKKKGKNCILNLTFAKQCIIIYNLKYIFIFYRDKCFFLSFQTNRIRTNWNKIENQYHQGQKLKTFNMEPK